MLLIFLIRRHISLALLHLGTIAGRNLLHTPTGDILGRGVEGQHIVQILMVQPTLDVVFNLGEVDHHTILIQLFRTRVDERLSQRAAREIYLRGFEIAVRESDPWTVMSSYNLVNGVFSNANKDLLTTILRDEWGFKGIVMTDWLGKRERQGLFTVDEVMSGNDLMEPGSPEQVQDIITGVNNGKLKMEALFLPHPLLVEFKS